MMHGNSNIKRHIYFLSFSEFYNKACESYSWCELYFGVFHTSSPLSPLFVVSDLRYRIIFATIIECRSWRVVTSYVNRFVVCLCKCIICGKALQYSAARDE